MKHTRNMQKQLSTSHIDKFVDDSIKRMQVYVRIELFDEIIRTRYRHKILRMCLDDAREVIDTCNITSLATVEQSYYEIVMSKIPRKYQKLAKYALTAAALEL